MLKNIIECTCTRNSDNGILRSDVIGFLNLMHQFIPADTTIFNNIKDSYNNFEDICRLYSYINDYIKEIANKYNKTSKIELRENFDEYYTHGCRFRIVPNDFGKAYSIITVFFSYEDKEVEIKIDVDMDNPEDKSFDLDLFIPSGKNRNLNIICTDDLSYNDPAISTLVKGNISFNEIYKYMTTLNDYKLSTLLVMINTKF